MVLNFQRANIFEIMKSLIWLFPLLKAQTYTCQQGNQTITTSSGTILSQNAGDTNYQNSVECGFILNTQNPNKIVKVS